MGARQIVQQSANPEPKPKRKYTKRLKHAGKPSELEKGLIADVLANSPGGLSVREVSALATVMRRSKDVIRRAVEEAHDTLIERAGRYADIHMQAVETALENGDAKSLEVAARASQWAMENINLDGQGVVEKPAAKPMGPSIQIGIALGGMNKQESTEIIEAKVIANPPLENV